jgi:hypothetical protein
MENLLNFENELIENRKSWTKPSSPYVSNRVRLHFLCFFLLYRTLGFMQIPDFFRSITEIAI